MAKEVIFRNRKMDGGMNLIDPSHLIANNEAIEAKDVYFDEYGLSKRKGNLKGNMVSSSITAIVGFESTENWDLRDSTAAIRTMESGETWTGGTASTEIAYTGSQSRYLVQSTTPSTTVSMESTSSIDLSSATRPYIAFYIYNQRLPSELRLYAGTAYYKATTWATAGAKTNWDRQIKLKTAFTESGSPAWASITKQYFDIQTPAVGEYVVNDRYIDLLEISSGWYTETYNIKTGTQAMIYHNQVAATCTLTPGAALDLTGSGTTADIVYGYIYTPIAQTLSTSYLRLGNAGDTAYYQVALGTLSAGWNLVDYAKSEFATTGSPNWNSLAKVSLVINDTSTASYLIFDNFYLEYTGGTATGITGLDKYYSPVTPANNKLVCAQGTALKSRVDSTGVWSSVGAALTGSAVQTYFANAFNLLWFVNGNATDLLRSYNGTTHAGSNTALTQASVDICFVARRLFCLGSAAVAASIGSTIYYSKPWDTATMTSWGSELIAPDVGGRGRRIVQYNENILLFKDQSIHLLYNLDNNDSSNNIANLRIKTLSKKYGLIAPRSLVETEYGFIFLDKSGVYLYDGIEFKHLSYKILPIIRGDDTTKLGTSLNYGMNTTYLDFACGAYYKHRYYLSYPSGAATTNDKTLVYDFVRNAWSVYNYGFNCFFTAKNIDISSDPEEEILWAGHPTTNHVYRLDYGTDDSGSAISMYFKSKHFDLGAPEKNKNMWTYIINYKSPIATTLTTYLGADFGAVSEQYAISASASANLQTERIVMSDSFCLRKYFNVIFSNSDAIDTIKILDTSLNFSIEEFV